MNTKTDVRWWNRQAKRGEMTEAEAGKERASCMTGFAKTLREDSRSRIDSYLHFSRLYYGYELAGMDPGAYADEPDYLSGAEPMPENVARSIVKTALPRVVKSKPRPMFMTTGGDWGDRTRALRTERVIAADFGRMKFWRKAKQAARLGSIYGTGALRWYTRDDKPACDTVLPWQIIVDPRDAYYGEPRSLYYWQLVDRAVLCDMYPDAAKDIEALPQDKDLAEELGRSGRESDMLLVWHAWHLPSGDDAGDGCYSCAVGDVELYGEKWEEDSFPFSFFRWSEPVIGFFGEGLVRDVMGHQYELQALTHVTRLAMRAGVPRTYIKRGSQVLASDLDDRVGTIIECVGEYPQLLSPAPIHGSFFERIREIRSDAFNTTGVSQLAASSQKPAGLNSGIALQRYDDIEDTRFLDPAEAWEAFACDSAEQLVRLHKRIAAETGEHKVQLYDSTRRRWGAELDWDDIELERDSYVLQVYPVSQLPSTPAGKSDLVESWFATGTIDADERRIMLELPDVEAYGGLRNAVYDLTCMQLEQMLFDGKQARVDPTQGPAMPIKLGKLYLCAALRDGCPEERLNMVRKYLDEAVMMADAQKPPAPPPMPPMTGAGAPPPMPGPDAMMPSMSMQGAA